MRMSLRAKLAVGCMLAVFGKAGAQDFGDYPILPVAQETAPATEPTRPPASLPATAPPAARSDALIEDYPYYAPYENGDADSTCGCEDTGCLFNDGSPWTFSSWLAGDEPTHNWGGWVNTGYHSRSDGYWNDQPDRVNLHQLWLFGEKVADGSKGLDWGYRTDLVYGIDGANTQAFGNRPGTWDFMNGWGNDPREALAMPQLYGQLAYGDLSVQIGHFYTYNGYEVVPATGNFFYSHAYTWNFSEPFTHTGVIASLPVGDKLTTHFGWVAGVDTGFDINMGGSAFHGGFNYAFTDNLAFSYMTCVGDLGAVGNGYFGTALIDWQLNDRWEWVVQNDIAKHDASVTGVGDFDSVAMVNYLFYSLNDCWKLGNRSEWYRVDGVDYYETTCGLNFAPHSNLIFRPEWRYQWSPEAQAGNNVLGVPVDVGIFGIDLIVTY